MEGENNHRLGYNLGLQKGTFAMSFNRKEYFEKVIRPYNKKVFEPGIQANRNQKNGATFIQYDKKQKEDFEDKV